jgi:uncharacterized Tic20 family protein
MLGCGRSRTLFFLPEEKNVMSDFEAPPNLPIPLPQPDEVKPRERDDAMGGYFMTFAALHLGLPLPFINVLANVIYHAINAHKSRFAAFHSLQALLAGIPVAFINAVAVIWGVVLLVRGAPSDYHDMPDLTIFWAFLVFGVIVNLVFIVVSIVAAMRAHKGRFFYFWIIGPFVYRHYYVLGKGPKPVLKNQNEPPKGF